MTTVTYSFEGGTNGSNVSAGSGAGPGDTNFDATSFVSATDIYDNTRAAHGTLSNKLATTTSSSTYNSWTTSVGTQTTVWVRAYLYFTAAPSVQHRVINFVGSAASRGTCLATTGGTLVFADSGGNIKLTSNAFPTGQWFRLEAMFTGSATVGQWIYKIWYQPDAPASSTPSDTQTSAANLNTGGTLDTYRFGISSNVLNAGPFWLDDLGVSTTGFIGPVATQIPAPLQAPRIPRRSSTRGLWTQPAIPATPASLASPPGSVQPPATRPPRRYPARGWFAAGAGQAPSLTPGTGVVPPHLVIGRRAPARGQWAGTVTRTVNAPPAPAVAVAAPLMRPAIPRRTASRALWQGFAAPAGPVQPPVIFAYGTPYSGWAYGTPYFEWATGDPYLS